MAEGTSHKIEDVLEEAHDGRLLTHPRLGVVGSRFRFCDASRDLLETFGVVENRDCCPARRPEAVDEREEEAPAAGAEQGGNIPALFREVTRNLPLVPA